MAASKKIILSTIGSIGDLNPFIAIGLELKKQGFSPILAVQSDFCNNVQKAGLDAVAISPSSEQTLQRLGITEQEAIRRVVKDQDFLIRHIVLPDLAYSAKILEDASEGAIAIIANFLSPAAPIIAEKHGIPFISALLQPMLTFSAIDPPLAQPFGPLLSPPPVSKWGLIWNRFILKQAVNLMQLRHAKTINTVRQAYGLSPQKSPLFEIDAKPALRLGLYSSILGTIQEDYPSNMVLTGFPTFDSNTGAPHSEDAELEDFLNNSSRPLVFTLGSFLPDIAEPFYERSLEAADKLKMRAILLTGNNKFTSSKDILVRSYAPHSIVFPKAAAIIHHGGIGTTGQALRSKRPQLVVPIMADQFDNAARLVRSGVAEVLPLKQYNANKAHQKLFKLLSNNAYEQKAIKTGQQIEAENGAKTAVEAIKQVI